jgi:hypothetical protein
MYPHLSYGRDELTKAMRATYDELIDFVTKPEFKSIMVELGSLPARKRQSFIVSVLLSTEELAKRGLNVPEGILIQRSAFGDRRPTLFCVKKYLPKKFHDVWQNVNLTFDNEFTDETVSRAPDVAWRQPLPVALQADAMAAGEDLGKLQLEQG